MEWEDMETGMNVLNCTMIVTNANALAGKVHDRMPMLLQPEDFPRWLAGTANTEMLKPAPNDHLQESHELPESRGGKRPGANGAKST
jgi:putative SOS response-associated peptidase YedK